MVQIRKKVSIREKTVPHQTKTIWKNPLIWGIVVTSLICLCLWKFWPKGEDNANNKVFNRDTTINVVDNVIEIDTVSIQTSQDSNLNISLSEKNNKDKNAEISLTTNDVQEVSSTSKKGVTDRKQVVEAKALEVIRGIFGNGEERKIKLGSEYQEIQNMVNEMYRKGLVH